MAGCITSLSILKKSGPSCSRDIMFFLKYTDLDYFYHSQGNHMQTMEPTDLYYQGTFTIPEEDSVWVTIPFSHPFLYDGKTNLIVGFFDCTNHSLPSDSRVLWQNVKTNNETSYQKSIVHYSDNTHPALPDPYDETYFFELDDAYVAWISSRRPLMKLTMIGSEDPVIVVDPPLAEFSDVPLGYWKHALEINLRNEGCHGSLDAVQLTGSSFAVEGPNTPVEIPFGTNLTYSLSTNNLPQGIVNETLSFTYSHGRGETLSIPVTANAYANPVAPDVYELAEEVNAFPYAGTPTQLHNTYWLPGDNEDGPDAVFRLSFDDDVLLNASVENGENPKIALYKEDFDGGGGPHTDNAYSGPALSEAETVASGWLYYDTGDYWGAFNSLGGACWAVKFTPEQLAPYQGCVLDKIRMYRLGQGGLLMMTIYMGGEDAPGKFISRKEITMEPAFYGVRWDQIVLDEPVILDITQNLWLVFYTEDIPFGPVYSTYCGDPNSCWCLAGDTWTTVADLNDGNGCSWMIRAFVTNEKGSRELGTEGVIDQMTVQAGTYYLVASSTSEGFSVNIDKETIPVPEMAYNPTPADGASDLMPTMKLKWDFGNYTTEYRLLLGTTNPPQEVVVDWTDALDTEYLTGLLDNRTHYYWRVDERNSSGITEGPVWSFTTNLVAPTELVVDHDRLYEGDAVTLSWNAPARDLTGYNIYQNEVLVGVTTTTSYTVDGLSYNMEGHQFAVTTVYAEGESVKTDPVLVYVTGLGSISGSVKEQDRTTPIEGVTVKVTGLDELGLPQLYVFTTDANGCYSGVLYAGNYKVSVLKAGYQTMQTDVTISYQQETPNVNFVMEEEYYTAGAVVAEAMDDKVRITWQAEPLPKEPKWVYYDNGYYSTNYSISSNGTYWGISFPNMSDYRNMVLTKIAIYDTEYWMNGGEMTVNIYLGGETAPQRLASTQEFTTSGVGKFIEVELSDPVVIDGTEPLWITCYCNNLMYPASACGAFVDPNGRWISADGVTWVDLNSLNVNYHSTWMLRGCLEDPNGSLERSLQYYNVYRSDAYDLGGAELIATEVTDTVFMDEEWNDFAQGVYKWGVSKSYQGNRKANGSREVFPLFSEGFEDGTLPEGWSQYGGWWSWEFTSSFQDGDVGIAPHGGNYAAFANSDGDSGTRHLVTPSVDLSAATEASLNFYYVLPDWGGDVDNLYVKYGESPNGPWTTLWTAPSDTYSWTEVTIDLAPLCGGTYYLAFVDVDEYGYGAAIDDVTVSSDILPEGFEYLAVLSEGYEGGAMPEGWSQYGGWWSWAFTHSFQDSDVGIAPHSGNYAAFANSDGDSGLRNLVTPAIDLTEATIASLSFWYVLPDWGGDVDALYVKYGTTPTGPWTTLWATSSETYNWTEATIDLSALCGGVYYIDFAEDDGYGYGGAIDDIVIMALVPETDHIHESDIVWSNPLDKDMLTTVEVQVNTSNAVSPAGTKVVFLNISEPGTGYDYEVTLDETGRCVWEEFRKGDYRYAIKLQGYESCADFDTISIWEPASLYCLLEESVYPVENLYVSPTGWAKWSGVPLGDEFYYDFEDGSLGDWTLIDADGDGYEWKLGMAGGSPSISGHDSPYCVYSESYVPSVGGIVPDNYLVSKRVLIGDQSVFSFYVCAQDEEWAEEHYGVAISTTSNADPASFTTIWEETLTAKDGQGDPQGSKGLNVQSDWYYKEIDLSAYAGQEVYIALRHFDCSDMFVLVVDDIRLSNGGRSIKEPLRYKVMLDGVFVDNVEEQYLQHDVSSMVPGETHTTTVAAVFATGISDWVSYEWTYVPCETFAGAENLSVDVEADVVTLHWTLPESKNDKGLRDGQWYYYDDGVCIDAIGTEAGLSIYWAVMFPAGQYEGNKLTKVSMFNREGSEHEGNIMIYQGGSSAPEELLYTQPYEATDVNDFVEYKLIEPVEIDETRNLWIVMNNTTGTFVASACAPSDDPNSGWVSLDGVTWDDIVNYGLYYSWMLRAYLETENYLGAMVWRDGELLTGTPIQGNSYSDENVSADWHEYCIRVVHAGMPDSTYYAMSCELCELADVTGVGEQGTDEVRIYPNPTSGEVTIKAEGMRWIRIVDMLGRKVYEQGVEGDEKTLNLASFGAGVYLVNLTTDKGVVNRRIVVHD